MTASATAVGNGGPDEEARTTSGTWHYGLVARWWAEFTHPGPEEVEYLRRAIDRFGQPALDLGCGNGRLLLPLLTDGLEVDGVDVSADMIALARAGAERMGRLATLEAQPMHRLDLPRRYRTIFAVGAFGIGGDRHREREALQHAYRHLVPGGALLINHELPYAHVDEQRWARWLPGHRDPLPGPWPPSGDRRTTSSGDEIELLTRTVDFDPLAQRVAYQMRARLWRGGALLEEETATLYESLYFAQELLQLLREVGYTDIRLEGGYRGEPATPDDGSVTFVAVRPGAGG